VAKEIKARTLARYNGHSIKTNKAVDLSLKFEYGELPNYIKLIQFLNENTKVTVKKGDEKPQCLGIYMVKEIKIDHDGEGIVKFNSMLDHVNADEITTIVGDEIFKVQFEATSEEAEEDEDN